MRSAGQEKGVAGGGGERVFAPLLQRAAWRSVGVFALFGLAWALASDPLLHLALGEQASGPWVEMGKNLAFVGISVAVLAASLVREIRREAAAASLLEERRRVAERTEWVAGLASGVAHDFNNLLTVILGHCDLAEASLDLPGDARESLTEIRRSGVRGVALTRELLVLGRGVDEERLLPLAVNALIDGLAPSAMTLVGSDHELVVECDPGAGWIVADPAQLERVLLNLIVNARDASAPGGRITVRTGARGARCGSKAHPPGHRERWVSIAVIDEGEGMSAETRARIFEAFFTTKGYGTGLGLAVAQRIVTDLGGRIEVESARGRGTCFEVLLPQAAATPESERAETEGAESGHRERRCG